MDWFEEERDWFSPKRELTRLKRRAQARWLIVIALAGLMTFAALRVATRPPAQFTSKVILRVQESHLLGDATPVVGIGLAGYLLDAALRNEDLAALLERHDIYTWELGLSRAYAAAEFRSDLEVHVYRNYFTVGRNDGPGNRTARISISYTDTDPDRATLVAREVAELMVATEAGNRRRASTKLAAIASVAVDAARTRLASLSDRLINAENELEALAGLAELKSVEARLRVEVRGLTEAIENQTKRLAIATKEYESINLRDAIVSEQLDVQMQIVDERPPLLPAPMGAPMLAMLGIVFFVVLFPLAGIAVGAFDSRVHDGADVERLGLPMLGRLSDD